MNGLALFAGAGGLELGLRLAIGPDFRTFCFVEREAYAAATLVARMEEGRLDSAPIWSDVSTFDGKPWRGVVDIVSGGFPCQDISNAGKRAGIDGERSGLWSEYARVVGEVRPRYVFVENVAALVVRGIERVLADLAALGFDAEWGVFRASDVGAPHLRERLFLLAHARRKREHGLQPERLAWGGGATGVGGGSFDVADAHGWRRQGERFRGLLDGERPIGGHDTDGHGCPWPPAPDDAAGWVAFLERWPGAEPAVRRDADGLADRVDRLRLCGNGVVPQQAALAFRTLATRLGG